MPPNVVDAIAPLIALGGLGVFSLIGLRMLLAYKARRLELSAGPREPGRVEDLLDDLRAEVQSLRSEVGDLHERVDFAERLLTRGTPDTPPAGHHP